MKLQFGGVSEKSESEISNQLAVTELNGYCSLGSVVKSFMVHSNSIKYYTRERVKLNMFF